MYIHCYYFSCMLDNKVKDNITECFTDKPPETDFENEETENKETDKFNFDPRRKRMDYFLKKRNEHINHRLINENINTHQNRRSEFYNGIQKELKFIDRHTKQK